ncbi:dTMP kinase [Candidatus Phytoplasma australasiaticum]|uniref:Thymidylate kinase n=1 Tax=Candidatus Phytoplasma australasiaticum subsp. australasiaticum TaxID=2832407 RepID=A0AAP4X8R7_9MOLU|nr:dTMP kinase [Candidatus Phytoplasma australasiaticum]MDO8054754.1 dTMP kinase [Candidatus Phytoplasma australasiaticum]
MPKIDFKGETIMKLIVFEGLDGSGKTTLIQTLYHQLAPFPKVYQGLGSSTIGKEIRDLFLNFPQVDYLTRFYLSLANMTQIQAELFKNHQLIICDRWLPSTYAYQLFPFSQEKQQLLLLKKIFKLNHETILSKPDLLIYLDIDPSRGLKRKQSQPHHQSDFIEQKPLTYFQTVRQGYQHYLTHYTRGMKKLILNGSDPVSANIKKIMKYLGAIK